MRRFLYAIISFSVFCVLSCGNDSGEDDNRKSNPIEGVWGLIHEENYDIANLVKDIFRYR